VEDQTRSLSEVAGLMGVSERTIRRWIKSGRLKAYKPGRDYRIPESGLRAFIEESEISPKAPAPSLELSFENHLERERRAAEVKNMDEMALLKLRRFNMRSLGLPKVYKGGILPEESAEERRNRTYGPPGEGLSRILDRWDEKAKTGNFGLGEVKEFRATVRDLAPTISEMERWEIAETPPEALGENNRNLILNQVIRKLSDTLGRLETAVEAKLEDPERLALVQKEHEETQKALIEGVEAANSA
jgi:excisionase family DNA binding protein